MGNTSDRKAPEDKGNVEALNLNKLSHGPKERGTEKPVDYSGGG